MGIDNHLSISRKEKISHQLMKLQKILNVKDMTVLMYFKFKKLFELKKNNFLVYSYFLIVFYLIVISVMPEISNEK